MANLTRLEASWKCGEMAATHIPPQLLQILVKNPSYPCPSRVHSQIQEVRLRDVIPHESNTLPGMMGKEGMICSSPVVSQVIYVQLSPKEVTELQLL